MGFYGYNLAMPTSKAQCDAGIRGYTMIALTPENKATMVKNADQRYKAFNLPSMMEVTYPDSHGSHVWYSNGRFWVDHGLVIDNTYTGTRSAKREIK